jgi:CxxC-x17-CxxC domain-containing protein
MKKKSHNDSDIAGAMNKIQEQLAVLDRKLDTFMTKSLTELAQARAAQKPVPVYVPPSAPRPIQQHPGRMMYAVVCYDCGQDTEIPFKPSGDRPVYCKECFAKRRSGQAPKVINAAPPAPAAPVSAPVKDKKKAVAKKAPAKKKAAKKKAK